MIKLDGVVSWSLGCDIVCLVMQCEKGHIACLACNGGGSRSIRCIAIETILKSLEVSCKYAQYGCKQMLGSLYIIRAHESYCKYKPFPCPVPECIFKGSRETLPKHLTVEHHVRTVAYNGISAAGFTMEPSDRIVMVTVDKRAGGGDMHLVHREVHQVLGEVFFCTTFHGELWDRKLTYNLKVQFKSTSSRPTLSLKSAPTQNLRDKEYWEKDFLLLPVKSMLPAEQVEVHFKVIPD